MKNISSEIIEQILQGNSESLNLEFKASFDFIQNVWARERLIRSILAMSNTREGGRIVIGISENSDKTISPTGITEDHFTTFQSKIEDLKSKVESFSSAPTNYEIGEGVFQGKRFIIIDVTEFRLQPIICRKTGDHKDLILEEGSIYIRTLKDKPSSIKMINPVDIQDFLERTTDKQIVSLHKRGWKHSSEFPHEGQNLFEKERSKF